MGKPIGPVVRAFKVGLAAMLGIVILSVLLMARNVIHPAGSPQMVSPAKDEISESHVSPAPKGETESKPAHQPSQVASARNVGGGVVAAPETIDGPLERVDPLPQPTPPAKPQPVEPFKPKNFTRWKLVFNSVIPAAGVFDLDGSTMVLPDIDIIPANETCIAPNGQEWPCGMAARTAFRNFVKGRAITCQVPDIPPQLAYVADCRLQGQDMAAWLVEQGWARAKPSTPFVEREALAKNSGRGIHGNPPAGIALVKRLAGTAINP